MKSTQDIGYLISVKPSSKYEYGKTCLSFQMFGGGLFLGYIPCYYSPEICDIWSSIHHRRGIPLSDFLFYEIILPEALAGYERERTLEENRRYRENLARSRPSTKDQWER